MSLTTAVAYGPISYLTSIGQQLLIPVTAFGFDANGQIQLVDPASPYSVALSWLNHLRETGYIRPGKVPAPSLAMMLRAADPGAWGNQIKIEATAAGEAFDLEVTATTTYTNVSLETLVEQLGTETRPGIKPGLVRFRDADLGTLVLPAPLAGASLGGGDDAIPVPAAATTGTQIRKNDEDVFAFQLVARKPGLGGNSIDIDIENVVSAEGTFSLKAVWNVKQMGLNPSTPDILTTINNAFGYAISVAAPPGGELGVPQTSTFYLTGGTDATKASASPITQ